MRTVIKFRDAILLFTSIVTFFWLLYILFQVNASLTEALNIAKSPLEINDYIFGMGHLFALFFNVFAIIMILSHFRNYQEMRVLKTILLILGIVSLFTAGIEKVMIDEIARQYKLGMSVNEIIILNISYIINMVFSVSVFCFTLRPRPVPGSENKEPEAVEERIFMISQYLGILSGVLGLLLVFDLSGKDSVNEKPVFYIPFFILFVAPYALAVLYWLSFKLKLNISDWYDEKQLQDIMKASLATLVLSIPGMMVYLFLGIQPILFFFLFYVFLVLVLFSAFTLIFNKM